MKDKIFYTVCSGFLLGVLWRSFFVGDIYVVTMLAGVALGLIIFFSLVSKNNFGVVFLVLIFSVCLGILRFDVTDVPNPTMLEEQVGQKVTLQGEVIDEPSIRENNQQLVVKIKGEEDKILLSVNFQEEYEYGDEIISTGTLKKPENFTTDQGKEFDYINYLRKEGIIYVMSYPKTEVVSTGNGNFIKRGLFDVKGKFLEKINTVVPPPESLLLGGLMLGEKSAFSEELRQNFVDTGTIHIVALSGYNVTIVAEWFMKLFSFLPLIFAIWSGVLAILLFVLMTGASSTAVRAGVMSMLALLARATGRSYEAGRGLVLAAVGMVLFNPFILVFDVSFQLSFIATVAVIFFAPKVEKYFQWVTESFGLRDIVSVTTAAYVFVCPFILYKMGNFSMVALPANILILPFIPLTMMLGFLTGFLGMISPIIYVPVGFLTKIFLSYELGVVGFFAGLPFASISFPSFPLIFTILIYAYFTYRLFGENIKNFFDFKPELL